MTASGKVSGVKLDATSGYREIDRSLVKLVKNMPEKWPSAKDANVKAIAQELVFFFRSEGC